MTDSACAQSWTSSRTFHEAALPEPWHATDAPAEFVEGLLNAIAGFDLTITKLEGKFKQSQNRPEADRQSVLRNLSDRSRSQT